jgi:hypothetical protein
MWLASWGRQGEYMLRSNSLDQQFAGAGRLRRARLAALSILRVPWSVFPRASRASARPARGLTCFSATTCHGPWRQRSWGRRCRRWAMHLFSCLGLRVQTTPERGWGGFEKGGARRGGCGAAPGRALSLGRAGGRAMECVCVWLGPMAGRRACAAQGQSWCFTSDPRLLCCAAMFSCRPAGEPRQGDRPASVPVGRRCWAGSFRAAADPVGGPVGPGHRPGAAAGARGALHAIHRRGARGGARRVRRRRV